VSGHTLEEQQYLKEHRWWSIEQIIQATNQTGQAKTDFAPRRLGELLKTLIAGPYAAQHADKQTPSDSRWPIDVGV